MQNKKLALIIMDGWGMGPEQPSNAIYAANPPFFKHLMNSYPHSQLLTSGENVGLPDGQMGNSEVGHLNIGAGRVVYQDLVKINKAIRENVLDDNEVLNHAWRYAIDNDKDVHLLGLVSDGGVHSHISHLKALISLSKKKGVKNVFVHAFTDGRDTDPMGGKKFIHELQSHLHVEGARLASICGRYYAMDRDKRWERIQIAYEMLVHGRGRHSSDLEKSIQDSYDTMVTDEFILPIVSVDDKDQPIALIKNGDVVICFNYRTDRCREITRVLTQDEMPEFNMKTIPLKYYTLTNYDDSFKNIQVIFDKKDLEKTLGEVLSLSGKTQLRIAETEKYPHVTFFFSGGRELPFKGENRIMIPSPKVATYDLKPSMSALELREAAIHEIETSKPDFICMNFANPDMVGHTGVFSAIVEAVKVTDACVEKIVEAGLKKGYSFLITSDHGNADYTMNPDGTPNTAHTTNPVPLILIDSDYKAIQNGKLADLAPSILKLMGIEIPAEMDGNVLI
jgi:2,3-bisphosphoglycerate-independent phosphoglycerate mutase